MSLAGGDNSHGSRGVFHIRDWYSSLNLNLQAKQLPCELLKMRKQQRSEAETTVPEKPHQGAFPKSCCISISGACPTERRLPARVTPVGRGRGFFG